MPATDTFLGTDSGLSSPARFAVAVTPDDANDLAVVSRSVFIGGSGTMKVTTVGGSVVTFSGLVAGTNIPIRASRIWSTGTTATLILALY